LKQFRTPRVSVPPCEGFLSDRLSSLGAARALPDYAFVGAPKAALEALVRSLALELGGQGPSPGD